MQNHTAEFIEKFDASRDPDLWLKLIEEETKEAEEAAAELLKELVDCRYVANGVKTLVHSLENLTPEQYARFMSCDSRLSRVGDALEDALTCGELFEEAHDRVHASNLSKLDDAGRPIRREDGKICKGPNYKPPVLIDLITGEATNV